MIGKLAIGAWMMVLFQLGNLSWYCGSSDPYAWVIAFDTAGLVYIGGVAVWLTGKYLNGDAR